MQRTAQDTYLLEQTQRGLDRLTEHTPKHALAAPLKAQALALLEGVAPALEQALQRAEAEGLDDHRASAALREARGDADDAYEGLDLSLKGHIFNVRAGDRAAGERLEQERRSSFGARSLSDFRELGIDRALAALTQVTAYTDGVLGPEHPAQIEAGAALTALREARRKADKEAGESLQARNALESARDNARRTYRAARRAFEAALILDGVEDQLDRYLQPPYRRRATSPVAPAPADPAPPEV